MRVALDEGAFIPERAHEQDAGMDLKSPIDMQIPPGESYVFDTGVHVEIPFGYAGVLMSKSGLNVKHGITSTGLIDCGYTGSIRVKLYNHGKNSYQVKRGDKISQLVVVPCELRTLEIVKRLENNFERGENGFGSSGR